MSHLAPLIAQFYSQPADLGSMQQVEPEAVPAPYRQLLVHEHHMTVTVEEFHRNLVDVTVLERVRTPDAYSRKILLTRQSDHRVVQFGLVRLILRHLDPIVRDRILSETVPLGRVLIEHNVLRRIRLHHVWHIEPGPDLKRCMQLPLAWPAYGRTAVIECDGEPAIELLEIVTPSEAFEHPPAVG